MRGPIALGAVAICLFVAAALAFIRAQHPLARTLDERSIHAAWIVPPGQGARVAFFQKQLTLDRPPGRAWAQCEALGGFTLYVNGDIVAKNEHWRPTRPAQNGLSARGQRLRGGSPAISLNYPREYQWGDEHRLRDAVLMDLTPHLKMGVNLICIQVESREQNAAIRLRGEIRMEGAREVVLDTPTGWRATALPQTGNLADWVAQLDLAALEATPRPTPPGVSLSIASSEAFSRPFEGVWLQAISSEGAWFRSEIDVVRPAGSPFLRILADRPYDLWVNGEPLTGTDPRIPLHATGEWILGTRAANDLLRRPDALGIEEVRSPFELQRDRPMPSSRPPPDLSGSSGLLDEDDGVDALAGPQPMENRIPTRPAEGELGSRPWALQDPSREALTDSFSFVAHDLRGALRAGTNTVTLRLAPATRTERTGRPGLAADGHFEHGASAGPDLYSPSSWTVEDARGQGLAVFAVPTHPRDADLPGLRWEPQRTQRAGKLGDLMAGQWVPIFVVALTWSLALVLLRTLRGSRTWSGAAAELGLWAIPALLVVLGIFGLAVVFRESQEAWVFSLAHPWWVALGAAMSALPLAALLALAGSHLHGAWTGRVRSLLGTHGWILAVALMALCTFFLRGWQLEAQPLDDDEYASTQAILAIARTGVPALASDAVIYTRGPLYHYLVAAFVLVFGEDLWVLRLPSVLFGTATALLIYRMGRDLLRSRWMGLAAMTLFAFHPFCVFTGHVVRFYQQQQFFTLLAVYLFVLGYVRNGSTRTRVLAVVAWLAAVLSQEISAVMIFQLAAGLVFLRRGRPWRADLPVLAVGLASLILIALDYAAFQILCLTRTEGVSPNVEARIGLNFIHPFNLASLFLGYARIHVLGSLLLVPSLIRSLRNGSSACLGLHLVLYSGVLLSNVLITHVSLRYQYWLIPVWLLLVVHGAAITTGSLTSWMGAPRVATGQVLALARVLVVLLLLVPWAPWRLPSSYDATILGDSSGAMRFIAANQREDDRVFVTEPHSHAALLETGRVDGYLSFPLLHDFHFLSDGRVVDRNGGADVIVNLGTLQREFQQPGRIWIALNREKIRNRAKNLRWEYPGSRVELFIRENCLLAHETYLWSVYLWDPGAGRWRTFDVAAR